MKKKRQLSTQNLVDHVNREAESLMQLTIALMNLLMCLQLKNRDIVMILNLIMKVIMEVLMKMK